jgi:hypothetical protein
MTAAVRRTGHRAAKPASITRICNTAAEIKMRDPTTPGAMEAVSQCVADVLDLDPITRRFCFLHRRYLMAGGQMRTSSSADLGAIGLPFHNCQREFSAVQSGKDFILRHRPEIE